MKPDYRIAIKRFDKVYWAVDQYGNVISQPDAFYMDDYFANDWSKMGIKDDRNFRMGGIFRSSSETSYQFIGDAAKILRFIFYSEGPNASAVLQVEKLNKSLTSQPYEIDYECQFNFSKAKDERLSFNVELLDMGVSELIKTREDVIYEIPIWNDTNTKIATLKPMRVFGELAFLTGWPIPEQGNTTTSFTTDAFNYRIYAINVSKTLIKVARFPKAEPIAVADSSKNAFVTGQRFMEATAGGTTSYPVGSENNFLFKALVDIKNVKFNTTIGFFIDNNSGASRIYRGRLWLIDAVTGVYDATWVYQVQSASLPNGSATSFSLTFDPPPFDVPAGKALIMQFGFDAGSGPSDNEHNVAWEKDNRILISFEHYTSAYDVQGLPIDYVGKELIKRITGGKAQFSSSLLTQMNSYSTEYDLIMRDVILMSGDSVRGAPQAVLKISLKDWLKTINVMCGAGLGVRDNKVEVEKMEYFYRTGSNNLIADLGDVSDNAVEPAEDMIFNEIHIGFTPTAYSDSLNGRDETHNTTRYLTPYSRDKKVLDLISPIKADGYGIFDMWVNFSLEKYKPSDNDDTIFALQLNSTPYAYQALQKKYYALYPQDINPNAVLTGILEPTNMPNPGLTPRRCLQRNGRIIKSYFYGVDYEQLKFQTSDRNQNLSSKIATTNNIVENENIFIGDLPDRIFFPFYLNPAVISPKSYKTLFDSNPYGYFKFRWLGVSYLGFPMQVASLNAKPKINTFQLLVTPENNLLDWKR